MFTAGLIIALQMVKEGGTANQEMKIQIAGKSFYVKVAAVCSFFTL